MAPKVEIYVKATCPFCWQAKALLDKKGVKYSEVNLLLNPKRRDEMIARANGRHTVPQIFINDEAIGGCDDLMALEAKGQLDARLNSSSAA